MSIGRTTPPNYIDPAMPVPVQADSAEALTSSQSLLLRQIDLNLLAAADGRDAISALRELHKGFVAATRFHPCDDPEPPDHPELLDAVCRLTLATVDLAARPTDDPERACRLLDLHVPSLGLEFGDSIPFILNARLVEKLIDALLPRGDDLSLHVAVSLVGRLARMNPDDDNLSRLAETVLNRANSFVQSPASLCHCLNELAGEYQNDLLAGLAPKLAHLCLDQTEMGLRMAAPTIDPIFMAWVFELLPRGSDHHAAGVVQRLERLLTGMATDAMRLTLGVDPGGRALGLVMVSCIQTGLACEQVSQACKQKMAWDMASAMASGMASDLAAPLQASDDLFGAIPEIHAVLSASCQHLPPDRKPAMLEALLSTTCDSQELLEHLDPQVRTLAAGAQRERLQQLVRNRAVEAIEQSDLEDVPDCIRLALTTGSGGEDVMAQRLIELVNAHPPAPTFWSQGTDEDLSFYEDCVVLSFHLDPEGELCKPGTQVPDSSNASNPEFLKAGERFAYPDWLAKRREILQQARPAIAANRMYDAVLPLLPKELASLTDSYASRLVTSADWPAMRQLLRDARPPRTQL